jgi:hypothetical protein
MSDGMRDGMWDILPDSPETESKMLEVVEAGESTLVVRSPDGKLYSISFDRSSGSEEVNITELNELPEQPAE